MAFSLTLIPLMDDLIKRNIIKQPFLSLGDQVINDPEEMYDSFVKSNKYTKMTQSRGLKWLLMERYNIDEYEDIDLNGNASITHDLSEQIANDLNEKFNTVYGGGTCEHIVDQRMLYRNVYKMCKVDGCVWHMSPVNLIDHGYYSLNPRFFYALCKVNGYKVEEAGVISVNIATWDVKYYKLSRGQDEKIRKQAIQESEFIMFSVVIRKTSNHDFIIPKDVVGADNARPAKDEQSGWINGLNTINVKKLNIAIWGTNQKCCRKIKNILDEVNAVTFIDNLKDSPQKRIYNLPVNSPDVLFEDMVDVVLIAADSVIQITNQIKAMGLLYRINVYFI